jgi:alpha-1,2-mannosyltransferase
VFGTATWAAFFNAIQASGDVYAGHAIFMAGLTSPYGVLMTLGVDRQTAFAVQAVVILLCAAAVALVWRSRVPLPIRAAMLLAATPVAVPVLMFYDLMLVFVALVWLSRVPPENEGWSRRAVTTAVFLLPLLAGKLPGHAHWMFAAITASAAFGLTLAIAWRTVPPRLFRSRSVIGAA